MIVRVKVVLNVTVAVDSDWRFDNLCGSHFQSQRRLDGITRSKRQYLHFIDNFYRF